MRAQLTLTLVVGAILMIAPDALAQAPTQMRDCNSTAVIRITALTANQLVECDGAREVADDWLTARWLSTESNFAKSVEEGPSDLGSGWDCIETRTDPANVAVACQPPPDPDGGQPQVMFAWQAYTVCGAPTYYGGFWKAVEVNNITCVAGRAIVRSWIKKRFSSHTGLSRKARRTDVGGFVCAGHFLSPRGENGTFAVECSKQGDQLVRFFGSP